MILVGARGSGILTAPDRELEFDLGGSVIGPGDLELVLSVSESNYGHIAYEEGGAYMLELTFNAPTYILDQQIEIPVTVSEYHNE